MTHPCARNLLSVVSILALALACATAGTRITEEDVVAAKQAGDLEDLFSRVTADLESEGARKSPQSLAMRARIGTLLGEKAAGAILGELERASGAEGPAPLAAIEAAELGIPDVEHYDESQAERLRTRIEQERERTERAILAALDRREQLGDGDVAEKVELTGQLLSWVAPDSDRALSLEAERSAYLADLAEGVDRALESEDLETAERMARVAQGIAPDNVAVQEQVAAVDAKLFEQRFWKRLEQGNPAAAYTMLQEASAAPNFAAVSKRLAPYAGDMADAIAKLAADQTRSGNLSAAYAGFHQARGVRKILGRGSAPQLPAERAFVDVMKKRYWKARKQDHWGLSWAYLEVVTELEPMSPPLRRLVRETREQVETVAVKRLAALPFQNSANGPEFGDAVSSKIIQYLFQQIPQDVRIIERQQLEDVLREKEIGKLEGELANADYIVQGDIQEARVEATEKTGKKTMRVETERETIPNPLYSKWVSLSRKDREGVDEPPKEITRRKKEDVSVETTVHRKVGVFSVSFRLVDSTSAKVVFADSLHEKAEFEDTSTEGVQLGDFELPFKMASLPSDLEILQELSDKVSEEIGARLVKVLAEPEQRYDEDGQRFIEEGNYVKASESLAFAHVLTQRKDKDVEGIALRLRESAVRSIDSSR